MAILQAFVRRCLEAAFLSRGPADLLSRRLEVGFAMRSGADFLIEHRSQEGRAPLCVVVGAWFGRPSMPALTWDDRHLIGEYPECPQRFLQSRRPREDV